MVRQDRRGQSQKLSQGATTSSIEPLTVAEATERRDEAIKNMVASIAKHDFRNVRGDIPTRKRV